MCEQGGSVGVSREKRGIRMGVGFGQRPLEIMVVLTKFKVKTRLNPTSV